MTNEPFTIHARRSDNFPHSSIILLCHGNLKSLLCLFFARNDLIKKFTSRIVFYHGQNRSNRMQNHSVIRLSKDFYTRNNINKQTWRLESDNQTNWRRIVCILLNQQGDRKQIYQSLVRGFTFPWRQILKRRFLGVKMEKEKHFLT